MGRQCLGWWCRCPAQAVWTFHNESVIQAQLAEERTAREALSKSEEALRELVRNATDVVFRGSADGVLEWLSDSVTDLLGWLPAELVGQRFADLVHPEDRPVVHAAQIELGRGSKRNFQVRIRGRGGSYRWIAVYARPVLDSEGRIAGRVGGWRDIEGEVRVRQALTDSEALLRQVLDAMPDVYGLFAPVRDDSGSIVDFEYLQVNEACCQMTGLEPAAHVGLRASMLFPGFLGSDLFRAEVATMETGEPLVLDEYRYPDLGGPGVDAYLSIRGARIGEALSLLVRDVTLQKTRQLALAASEQRLSATLDSMLDPHVVLQAVRDSAGSVVDFTYTEANHAAVAANGMRREELVGANLLSLFPSGGESPIFAMYLDVLRTGQPLVLDSYPISNDLLGEVRHYDIRVVRVGDSVSYTWRDVSDRFAAQAALLQAQAQYQLLAENASDIAYSAGADRPLTWVSPAVTTALGWEPAELVGKPMADLLHPEDAAATEELRIRAYRGQPVENPKGGFVVRMAIKSGGYRWMSNRVTTVHNPDGSPAGVVGGLTDVEDLVAERHRAEANEARLSATLNSLMDPHVMLRAVRDDVGAIVDFTYEEANDAACRYLRMAREQLQGARLLEVLPAQATSGMVAMLAQTVETGTPLALDDFTYSHAASDSQRRYDIRAVKVGDGMSYTWRDITDRYEAVALIAQSEQRFRLLAENTTDIVALSRDGVYQLGVTLS